jgi:hypothetical protein
MAPRRSDVQAKSVPTTSEDWCSAQWHPQVHWKWYEHELFFWLFGFKAGYRQKEVLDLIENALLALGHSSYTCYELIGPYDLIVRVWMKPGEARRMDKRFRDLLKPRGMNEDQRFSVDQIVRHWVWASKRNGTGRLKPPADGVINERRSDRELDLVDRRTCVSSGDGRLLRRYHRHRLLAPTSSHEGIKLVLLISPVIQHDVDIRASMRDRLAELLDSTGGLVSERSLYYAENQFLMFIVMCRVPFVNFHLVREKLLARIADSLGLVDVRITTHAVTSPGALRFRDTLPRRATAPRSVIPDIEELLTAGESARVEFKGSAFAPLNDWLAGATPLQERESFTHETVLKTIAGFLNSGGGTLVIGILEVKRQRASETGDTQDGEVPPSTKVARRLATFPSVNDFVCIGLQDPTYARRGWDAFSTKLEQIIRRRIHPDPGFCVGISRVMFKERAFCVVNVVDDPLEMSSFYVNPQGKTEILYVRRNATTRMIDGPAAERHHQQRRKRGTT